MKKSESVFVPVRGLRYHCRVWGPPDAPTVFLLHGRDDLSASWQFTVDALRNEWRLVAPDWRGYGQSDRSGADSYWIHDYVADLAIVIDRFQPEGPLRIVGHSMGGSLGCTYAGLYPDRVVKVVNIEGIGPPSASPGDAPQAFLQWIASLRNPPKARRFASLEDLASRLRTEIAGLTAARAGFLAEAWADRQPDGSIVRRADPAHRVFRPLIWRMDEEAAIWGRIRAPILYIEGTASDYLEKVRSWRIGIEERLALFPTLVRAEPFVGAGHNLHLEEPERLARVVEEFLAPL